jgi:hypothetical protein
MANFKGRKVAASKAKAAAVAAFLGDWAEIPGKFPPCCDSVTFFRRPTSAKCG